MYQTKHHFVHNQKENCHYDHIPFNLKRIWIVFLWLKKNWEQLYIFGSQHHQNKFIWFTIKKENCHYSIIFHFNSKRIYILFLWLAKNLEQLYVFGPQHHHNIIWFTIKKKIVTTIVFLSNWKESGFYFCDLRRN